MGLRGPAPAPTALKLIRGNPGKRTLNKREPKPRGAPPQCPEHIASNPVALGIWNQYLPILCGIGVLTEADGSVLADFCIAESLKLHNLERYKLSNGHIDYAHVRDAINQCNLLRRELGLTPSARSRLQVEPEKHEETNPFLALG